MSGGKETRSNQGRAKGRAAAGRSLPQKTASAPKRETVEPRGTKDLRQLLFETLLSVEQEGKYANLALNAVLSREVMEAKERGLFTRIFYGVIERRGSLDLLIAHYSDKKRIEEKVRILLRMGIYQLLWCDGIPDHAAVSETVELTRRVCHPGAQGFVNAVLRRIARERDSLPLPAEGSVERLAFDTSIPKWIIERWMAQYGEETGERIARATAILPPMTLRVNTLRTTRAALMEELASLGIECEAGELPYTVVLRGACPLGELLPLSRGDCFVQDLSSQICAASLGARKDERILDCCACPGGKSFSLAMLMENTGEIVSRDLHESKLSLIRSGAERMGISSIRTACADARMANEEDLAAFDRVLCDVPCSGLGVIAKKPDLRSKTEADLSRLPEIQSRILHAMSACVRPGGVLLYSTCTLNRAENEEVFEAFLASHPEFAPCTEDMPGEGCMHTFFPFSSDRDGFFLAKAKRVQ